MGKISPKPKVSYYEQNSATFPKQSLVNVQLVHCGIATFVL